MVELLIILIVLFALLFDYTNGFHDTANVVSTVIASNALNPKTAIFLASILNAVGAIWFRGVAKTIASGIILPHATSLYMILSALIGALCWNLITWYYGIPSSSSYALIGGLLGSGFMHFGPAIVIWPGFFKYVIAPMILSPLIGFFIAFFFMKGIFKLESHYGKALRAPFRIFQIISSSVVALAHGLNDAQKSMGIITLGLFTGGIIREIQIPFWVILSCAFMMGIGTATGGYRIIRTMSYKITKIRPSQGFAAETSSSTVILIASAFGLPVSSTQVIAGSITGVGSAKTISGIKWPLIKNILWAWVLTLPGSAFISVIFYFFFTLVL